MNVNYLAAEANLQLGRFADAKAHAKLFERCAHGPNVKCFVLWVRAHPGF